MTFEEFFKKKRIDVAALRQAEPALSAQFELHFEQMGEKSFDHTKKYWFNKLREQFHLAPELKPEKPKVENQLAEQTVTEELNEMTAPSTPKVGFTPRFKAPVPSQPVENTPVAPEAAPTSAESEKPKVGFTPRFKAGLTKPAEQIPPTTSEEKTEEAANIDAKPKVGFTPRFKAGVTKPAELAPEEKPIEDKPAEEQPKMGFTPRFKAGVTKTAATPVKEPEAEVATPIEAKPAETTSEERAAEKPAEEKPKIGFTPRFKAGVIKAAATPVEEAEAQAVTPVEAKPSETMPEEQAAEKPAGEKPKMGFTPRFKAGVTKQAPPPADE